MSNDLGIEYVFFDLDGCLSRGKVFDKSLQPRLDEEMPTMREFMEFMKPIGVRRAAATGRSITISRAIIDALMDDLSVVEHGTILYDPISGSQQHIVDSIELYYSFRPAKECLERFAENACQFDDQLSSYCAGYGVQVSHLGDNIHIYTVEFSPRLECNALLVADFLESRLMPTELVAHIRAGRIRRMTSNEAVDYLPPVSKKDGVAAVIKIKNVDPSRVLVVGDSYSSDSPMMMDVASGGGYLICPSNSDTRLKQFVSAHGCKGYVANKPYFGGSIQGLHYFFDR